MILRTSFLALRLVAGLLAVVILAFLVLAWRLSGGPVSLGFLTPYVGEVLSDRQAGFTASIGSATLSWSGTERTLGLSADKVRLTRSDGTLVAFMPEVAFRLSLKALLHGRLAPTSVDITGVRLNAVREADGRIDIGFRLRGAGGGKGANPASEAAGATEPAGDILGLLVRQLTATDPADPAAYLTRASIRDASLTLDDKRLGVTWDAPEADLVLSREAAGILGRLRLGIELGGKLARLNATLHIDRASHAVRARALIGDFVPASLAKIAPALAPLSGLDLPISGSLSLTADGTGRIGDVDFDLAGGAGQIVLPNLAMAPLTVRSLGLAGSARDDFHDLHITRASLDLPDFTAQATGEITFGAQGMGVKLQAGVPRLATDALQRYWPASVASHARDWIVTRISGGSVTDIRLDLALPPGALGAGTPLPPGAVQLTFAYSGLKVRYLKELPLLEQAKGTARLTSSELDMSGITGAGGGLALREGKVVITGLDQKDQTAAITFTASGKLADALALLDRPPLHFISPMGIKPASVGGTATVEAKFGLPLKHDLTFAEMQVSAKAQLKDVSVPKVADRFSLSQGELSLAVDTKRLDLSGKAVLAGTPLTLDWRENFLASAPFASRYHLQGRIDEAGRKALGFDAAPYVGGAVGADVTIETRRGGAARIEGTLDLKEARLALPEANWVKPAGTQGQARFDLAIPRAGITNLNRFTLDAGDLQTAGSAAFDRRGLTRLDLSPLRLGKSNLALAVKRTAGAGAAGDLYRIDLSGKELDLEPFLDQSLSGKGKEAASPKTPGPKTPGKEAEKPGPDLDLQGQLATLRLGPGRTIENVSGHVRRQGGLIAQASLKGRLGPKAMLTASLEPMGQGRRLAVTSDDAGAVIRIAGITGDIVGGSFALDATIADDKPGHPATGQIVMRQFKLIKAPVLARLLTIASLSGIGEILSGQGIAFDQARIPFTYKGSKIAIRNALGHGGALGFTLEGDIDTGPGTLNLGGTLVPSYTLNTLLGKLPLIGNILTNRPGEGVFGITYRVQGPIQNPQVSVNPLSALTPGILRRIFEIGSEPSSSSSTAPPAGPMKSGPPQGGSVPAPAAKEPAAKTPAATKK